LASIIQQSGPHEAVDFSRDGLLGDRGGRLQFGDGLLLVRVQEELAQQTQLVVGPKDREQTWRRSTHTTSISTHYVGDRVAIVTNLQTAGWRRTETDVLFRVMMPLRGGGASTLPIRSGPCRLVSPTRCFSVSDYLRQTRSLGGCAGGACNARSGAVGGKPG
jgi:hypothetical protein